MTNLWLRLNYLVEEPQCRTFDNDYSKIIWNDARQLPTEAEIDAVDINVAKEDLKEKQKKFKKKMWTDLDDATTIAKLREVVRSLAQAIEKR